MSQIQFHQDEVNIFLMLPLALSCILHYMDVDNFDVSDFVHWMHAPQTGRNICISIVQRDHRSVKEWITLWSSHWFDINLYLSNLLAQRQRTAAELDLQCEQHISIILTYIAAAMHFEE